MRAVRDYEEWGNEWPSDRGCENLLQVRAAEEIHGALKAHGIGWLTLEQCVSEVSQQGTPRRGRYYQGMTDRQRVDVAVWSGACNIYGLIEIKREESTRAWRSDVTKLSRMLATFHRGRGNHLRWAVFGALLTTNSARVAEAREKRLREVACEVASNYGLGWRVDVDVDRQRWNEGDQDGLSCGTATVILTRRVTR
ncbi:MAG: hypothetical protein V4475_22770 [Pseudomonadota bacterium]